MKLNDLKEEVGIEFELMDETINELLSLKKEISGREPTVREKTAAAAFLAQWYGGVENILKRFYRYHNIALPVGDNWHTEIVKGISDPPLKGLPLLIDNTLFIALAPFRKFRHVVYHGYGFQLEWARMLPGIEQISTIFLMFKERVERLMDIDTDNVKNKMEDSHKEHKEP
ncbi:hypothetical protein KKE26_09960 [bacterium]|nr:hypothetical protein [bacterium]MBU1752326.1 hypothetical protein [bacterium]